MTDAHFSAFYASDADPLAIVLGTSEIASAVAVKLSMAGFAVVMSHDPFPPVIRRAMAFHDALFGDAACVEGVHGERAENTIEIAGILSHRRRVAVTPLHLSDLLAIRRPDVLIDARMQKHRITPDYRGLARITVGLGPNFLVGANCDVAVETRPAKNGSVVAHGETDAADGMARPLGGVGRERFVYTAREGLWHTPVDIGMRVFKGFVLGHLDGLPAPAPIDGILRGIARDGTRMPAGVKLLEIDPRGRKAKWTGMDERGRGIAEAALAAIMLADRKRRAIGATPATFVH
jgi:xanthine dehydrogenase accessory factor